MDIRRTEETKARISKSCRASARQRRKLGLIPGRASTPEVEAERVRKISEARKGMKFSERHKEKLSIAHFGVTPNWKNPEERARKISLAQKGKPASRKKLLAIRRAGKLRRRNIRQKERDYVAEAGMRKFRSFVKARDGYRCQQCKRTLEEMKKTFTPYLVMHHINHNHEDFWLDNLITLCHPCNIRAEAKKYRVAWEKKFKKYTKAIVYVIE